MEIADKLATDSSVFLEEEEKKSEENPPPMLEPFQMTNWDEVQLHTRMFRRVKHRMVHPYARKNQGNISQMIEVDVEGEIKNGVPHGQCFLWFIYKGELKDDY